MKTVKVNLDRLAANSYEIHIGEEILDRKLEVLDRREREVAGREQELRTREATVVQQEGHWRHLVEEGKRTLEQVAGLTSEEAKAQLKKVESIFLPCAIYRGYLLLVPVVFASLRWQVQGRWSLPAIPQSLKGWSFRPIPHACSNRAG